VDGEADVPLLGEGGLSRVDAHSNSQRHAVGPVVTRDRALNVRGGGYRVLGARKGDEERIALGVDFPAASFVDSGPDETIVIGESLAVPGTVLAKEARRSLDVREEECDGAAEKLRHRTIL